MYLIINYLYLQNTYIIFIYLLIHMVIGLIRCLDSFILIIIIIHSIFLFNYKLYYLISLFGILLGYVLIRGSTFLLLLL